MSVIDVIKRMLKTLRAYWPQFVMVCTLGLIMAILEMIPPKLVGQSIDYMAQTGFQMRPILVTAGIWAGLAIAIQILLGIQIELANRYGEKIISDIREQMFQKLQSQSISFFDKTHTGSILSTYTGDVDAIRHVLVWGLNTLFANATIMLLAASMIYMTDHQLFFATVWLFPTMAILNFIYGKKITAIWEKVRSHASLVGANQAENIVGVKVVHAFNRQNRNLKQYNELQKENTLNNVEAAHKSGLFQPLLQWVRFIGIAIILVIGGYRLSRGQMKPGNLVSCLLYWEWFMNPAMTYGAFFNELLIAVTGAARVFGIIDENPQVHDLPGAKALPPLKGDIEFENVSFRYNPNDRLVLNNVSFKVRQGSVVALVGGTGSGKSTIISMISRFYQPFVGRVLIDGEDIRYVQGKSLHRQLAMVLQANFLFSGTIMENLKYVRPEATDEEIFNAARTLGCHDRFLSMPEGYNTHVGEKGCALSIGERQLVCFTRALVVNPKILLLDEATSALDPRTSLQVQKAMHRLMRGRTTFIVTHRLSTVTNSDMILMLENGEIAESGEHTDLMRRKGPYSRLFQTSLSRTSS